MTIDAGHPNRLREYRQRLGWTQQEMADRLAQLAWMQRREHVGVNGDMIAKWERGVKGVSPRYRDLLCCLFRVTPDQLGLKPAPTAAAVPAAPPAEDESLVGMLDHAAALLDQLGAAGTTLAPHLLHAWRNAAATRRTMLGMLDPAAIDPPGHALAATATLADLEQLTGRYRVLYESADPAALLTSIAAHVRMAQAALGHDPAPQDRRRLLTNLAEAATLAGRLTAEDVGNPMSGRAYYSLALQAARQAGDEQLTTAAHGHAARLAAADGMTVAALEHLTTAGDHARPSPTLTGWLASLEATIHADQGDHPAARDALHRARTALAGPTSHPAPASLSWPTPAGLTAATGHTALRAGDHPAARQALADALDQLPPTARRHRILVLLDLATAELQANDPAAACAHASDAAALLHQAPYATGTTALRAFRAAADRPLDTRALRALDQQLAHLAA